MYLKVSNQKINLFNIHFNSLLHYFEHDLQQ